jgi:hypothetical protein
VQREAGDAEAYDCDENLIQEAHAKGV